MRGGAVAAPGGVTAFAGWQSAPNSTMVTGLRMSSRRAGFTLLEICLAIVIGLMVISIAVPSVTSVLRERDLRETFEEFDGLVRQAQSRSVTERRTMLLVWEEDAVTLVPEEQSEDDADAEPVRFAFPKGGAMALERPKALVKEPPPEWPFWRSGVCEPVIVSYKGPQGSWQVAYSALTVRGTFLALEVR
jgi:type II secretory pathway pseudopilin PulG